MRSLGILYHLYKYILFSGEYIFSEYIYLKNLKERNKDRERENIVYLTYFVKCGMLTLVGVTPRYRNDL